MSEILSVPFQPNCISDTDVPTAEQEEAYAGIVDRQEKLRSWAKKLGMHEDDLEVFLRNGITEDRIPARDTANRRTMLAYLKKKVQLPPKWILVSGLWPEQLLCAADRRKRVRCLYKATVLLIRRALAEHELDPDQGERSIFWDPIVEVCWNLEIAPSKLSALCKEFSGHSLVQLVDCVRVERALKLMRAEIREFVRSARQKYATCASLETKNEKEVGAPLDRWAVWKAIKAARKWPEFSQNGWANGLGFATYRRLYRACVAVYGKTPHQMEMELIQEFLDRGVDSEEAETVEGAEMTLEEIEAAIRAVPCYSDGGGNREGNGEEGS